MKYNYTDTFRSTLELASELATRYGASELTLEYLLAGILEEGTSRAIRFFTERNLPWQALRQEMLDHFELHKREVEEKHVPPYSVDAHIVLAKTAEISTLLGAEAISPLHLLYGLYYFEGWDYLRVYCETFGYSPKTDGELDRIYTILERAEAEDKPSPKSEKKPKPKAYSPTEGGPYMEAEEIGEVIIPKKRRGNARPLAAFSIRDGKIIRNDKLLHDIMETIGETVEPELHRMIGGNDEVTEETRGIEREDPRELLEQLGAFVPSEPDVWLHGTPLFAKEMVQITETLLRQRPVCPILVGEHYDSLEDLVSFYANAIDEDSFSYPTPRYYHAPRTFRYKEILKVTPSRLLAGVQTFGAEMVIRTLAERLLQVPSVLLYIPDIHLLRPANARGQGVEFADLLVSGLTNSGIRFLATTTPTGYSQSIERSDLILRSCYKIPIEPTAEDLNEQIFMSRFRQVREHNRIEIPFSRADMEGLWKRYFPQRPFYYVCYELLDLAGAISRQRRKVSPKSRAGVRVLLSDLHQAVARLANIPVDQVSGESEVKELQHLPARLKELIIGQDHAIDHISRAIQRAKLGLRDAQRPIASFLFLGPTGVGKTYLAKALAREVFGSEDALVRIDMSEFTERFSVTRLIGSPPGYIGFGEGGELTEPVRSQPHRLILLDEIEKAHPDIYNLLLQLLDDGRLTDSEGRTVDFRHTLIILTSNVGSREAKSFARSVGFAGLDEAPRGEGIVRKALERTFSPEFLGRLDETIAFNSLDEDALRQIVRLELRPIMERLQQTGYQLEVTDEAVKLLARADEAKTKGARFIRRRLQSLVEDRCVEAILTGALKKGQCLSLDATSAGELQHTIS